MTDLSTALSKPEAQALVAAFQAATEQTTRTVRDAIRAGDAEQRRIVREFIQGRGYIALGYASMKDAAKPLFGYSRSWLYGMAQAAGIVDDLHKMAIDGAAGSVLDAALSDGNESSKQDTPLLTTHANILAPLRDPRLISEARHKATAAARAQGVEPNRNHYVEAVKMVGGAARDADKEAVLASDYSPVKQWMNTGRLTPKHARLLVDALNGAPPKVRGELLLMEIMDAAVVRALASRHASDTYAEIVLHRELRFMDSYIVPARKATAQNVEQLFAERAREHRQQGRAIKEGFVILAARLVGRDIDGKTLTFEVPESMLQDVPMGTVLEVDIRWEAAAIAEEAA